MKGIRTSRLFIPSLKFFIKTSLIALVLSFSIITEYSNAASTEVNGRILFTHIDNSKVSVLLQINTASGLEAMGGTTMILGIDTSAIRFNINPLRNVDYIFHNFCGGNYSLATVTRPTENRVWINIDLPFQKCQEGMIVAGSGNWTDVVTINFDVIDQNKLINIYWLCNSPFWGIYDDDNSSFWNIGQFEDALNIPLPIELHSFTAKLFTDKVELYWVTESEIDNFGFEVERKINDGNWIFLDFVSGSGNSNTPKTYSFTDDKLLGGSHFYYRLKQIDTDGHFDYSEIIEVVIDPHHFSLSQNYPNPVNPSTTIRYSIPSSEFVTLKVYDILGKEAATLVNEEKQAGNYEINFIAAELSSGIYFYKLQAGSFVDTKKMILLK